MIYKSFSKQSPGTQCQTHEADCRIRKKLPLIKVKAIFVTLDIYSSLYKHHRKSLMQSLLRSNIEKISALQNNKLQITPVVLLKCLMSFSTEFLTERENEYSFYKHVQKSISFSNFLAETFQLVACANCSFPFLKCL